MLPLLINVFGLIFSKPIVKLFLHLKSMALTKFLPLPSNIFVYTLRTLKKDGYKNIIVVHFICLIRYLLYNSIILSVMIPGLPLLIIHLSIFITGSTPTVVLVRKASLHFSISLIVKDFSFTKKPFDLAILITQSLVTPPKIKLLAG